MNQEHKIVLYQVEDTNIYVNVMFKERYKISPSDYRSICVKEMLS